MKPRLLLFFFILSFLSTIEAKSKGPLFFGVPPIYNHEDLETGFTPIVNYLSKSLNRPVVLVISNSYKELVDDLKSGQTDIAILGPALYVEAKDRIYPELIYIATAQTETLDKKKSYYYSYIISHIANRYNSLLDTKGKTFGLVSKNSTSGYKYPLTYLYKKNIYPESFFTKVIFSGTHENLTDMIAKKEIEIGATYEENLRNAEKKHGKIFTIIEKLGPIANLAIVMNHRVDNITKLHVKNALVNIPDNVINSKMPFKGYEVLSDNFYDPVREVNVQLSAQKEQERKDLKASLDKEIINEILTVFINQKKRPNEISDIIKNSMLNTVYKVNGSVGYFKDKIYYNYGWMPGSNALEILLDNKMIVMIINQKKLPLGQNVSFDIKIVGMMGNAIVAKVAK